MPSSDLPAAANPPCYPSFPGFMRPEKGLITYQWQILAGKCCKYRLYAYSMISSLSGGPSINNVTLRTGNSAYADCQRQKRKPHELLGYFTVLDNFENSRPSELSGGMRQRAALIRTLSPGTGSPASWMNHFPHWTIRPDLRVRRRHRPDSPPLEKRTAILVTHDLSEAISLADRVITLSSRPATDPRDIVPTEFESGRGYSICTQKKRPGIQTITFQSAMEGAESVDDPNYPLRSKHICATLKKTPHESFCVSSILILLRFFLGLWEFSAGTPGSIDSFIFSCPSQNRSQCFREL